MKMTYGLDHIHVLHFLVQHSPIYERCLGTLVKADEVDKGCFFLFLVF